MQGWLVLILSAFLLLVIVSVCLTFWALDAQRQDAQVINLAGRQRVLIQQMSSLALEYEQEPEVHLAGSLRSAASAFEQTQRALRYGGAAFDPGGDSVVLPPAGDPRVIAGLDALDAAWRDFRPQIHRLLSQAPPAASSGVEENASASPRPRDEVPAVPASPPLPLSAQSIARSAPVLVALADQVVHAYEAEAAGKINRLRTIQLGFLVSGLALLCISWIAVRDKVIEPLSRLDTAARRIGEGELESPILASGPLALSEISLLGSTMESMRGQLLDSRSALHQSIDTLETRVRQRTRELEALAAVSQEIISHLALEDVLHSITEKARQLMGSEIALLCLLDEPSQSLRLQAAAGPEAAVISGTTPVCAGAGRLLAGKTAVPCGTGDCSRFCAILNPAYTSSHLAAPLHIGGRGDTETGGRGGQVIGALCVGSARPGRFRSEASQALAQLAGVAAVALENARLYEQVEQVTALEERQRIASDMHDGLLQTLSFLRWMVHMSGDQLAQGDVPKALDTYHQIERAEEQAEAEIRKAIASLQEETPLRCTLQEQLAGLAVERSAAGPPVTWQNCVAMPAALPRQESEQILNVAREAVLNAQNHSQAGRITVRLEKESNEWRLSISDDGIGFTPAAFSSATTRPDALGADPGDERAHFGLKIMRARAARLNGRLAIDSAPGQGTRVVLCWPEAATGGTTDDGFHAANARPAGR